jgi:hypothetical protein
MEHRTSLTRRRAAACVVALCAARAAMAQPAGEPAGQVPGGPMRHELLFLAGAQLERERVVPDAPYCADAVHESVQLLADGNRIVQRQVSRQCRDGQGRTRQEVTAGGRLHVYVRDPAAHEAWVLDPDAKQAIRLGPTMHGTPDSGGPGPWNRFLGWGRELRTRLHLGPAAGEVTAHPDGGPEAVRIMRGGPFNGELPAARSGTPPPLPFHARLPGPRGAGTVTPLAAETVEGLKAEAKRTTWTIEAGKIGNERPIVIVSEVWTSPELGITLRSRDIDPVVGEDSYRVQNVVRGEPDASLFRVPADFTKVTAPALMMMRSKP